MSETDVIESFNHIAELTRQSWIHNSHYHAFLLRHLPERRGAALDIGSGLGEFSLLLARHFDRVEAIDFSPRMVELATGRSAGRENLDYRCEAFLNADLPEEHFDCVASLATFHHLPFQPALEKAKRLLILDLYQAKTVSDHLWSAAGVLANPVRKVIQGHSHSAELKKAWQEHGLLDQYMRMEEIRQICQQVLPKAHIRRHLYFRYSLIWKKE